MLYFFSVLGGILMSNSGGNCIVTDRMGEGGCNEAAIGYHNSLLIEEKNKVNIQMDNEYK